MSFKYFHLEFLICSAIEFEINPILGVVLLLIFIGGIIFSLRYLERCSAELPIEERIESKPEGLDWETCFVAPKIFGEFHKIASFKYHRAQGGLYLRKKSLFSGDGWYYFDDHKYESAIGVDGILTIDRR